jgi:hypothetical protein
MKTIIFILLCFGIMLHAGAQDDLSLSKKEIKRFHKEQRKLDQKAELERQGGITKWMVTGQQFVLKANDLSDRYGNRIPVSSTINFIMVDSSTGVMQLGNAYSMGYNGVGGTTLEGRISEYEVRTIGKKKEAWSVSWTLSSTLGTYNISLTVSANGNADASIRSNWPGSINYHGNLVPISGARIYKGSTTY